MRNPESESEVEDEDEQEGEDWVETTQGAPVAIVFPLNVSFSFRLQFSPVYTSLIFHHAQRTTV